MVPVSGEVPKNPVVTKTGHVYERSLLETYVKETGNDPVTGEAINLEEDIIVIQASSPSAEGATNGTVIHPKQPTLTSIPSLLSSLQSEWDALILETFSLKQQLLKTRQELSTALYINDAAVRVSARLTKERDEAREELAKLAASLGSVASSGANTSSMDVDANGQEGEESQPSVALPSAFIEKITSKSQVLASTRKANSKKELPAEHTTVEGLGKFVESFKSKQLFASVSHLSVNEETGDVVTGGGKSQGGIFSTSEKALIGDNFQASGIVTGVCWDNEAFAVATKAGVVDYYQADRTSKPIHISSNQPLISIASFPAGQLVVTADKNGTWYVVDLESGTELSSISNGSPVTSLAVHPDGELVAVGSADGNIRIHKVTDEDFSEPAAVFPTGSDDSPAGSVTSLSFSENGYWLAASSSSLVGQVQIWNLRKLSLLTTVPFETLNSEILSIKFDPSGQYLAAASSEGIEVAAYNKQGKSWTPGVLTSSAGAVDLGWTTHAKSLVSITSKGSIHIFEQSE
ncbi:E3 ubiquitin-protein ligase PRP19 [Sugiyamaella lignohabitans]|uniref:Pre-mRNA-processing factor 19 n=1 Tax=Sugiyamaella lignohabitans TaxID=796027 RepID=A0A161HJT2_9ASCO|nr:E3 ubiquitin-protein ligase PRP19 [Sugiyamaella lignohabitans]ANB11738.1 E3 ubiquitin-protein ligase PRP19 [Sugiyamaella lignohabitans]